MASQPQPPIPRRTDYTFAWILLGVLAFAGVLVFTGIYVFSRYIARQISMDIRSVAGGKGVDIETPAGSLKVQQGEISEEQLGLPIYPGARRFKREGATISLDIPSDKSLQVVAAEFETDDALEAVGAFYRKRLGKTFSERRHRRRIEFLWHEPERQKRVVIWRNQDRTAIALANITEARTN